MHMPIEPTSNQHSSSHVRWARLRHGPGALAAAAAVCSVLLGATLAPAADPPSAPRLGAVGPPLTALDGKIADPDWLVAWLMQPSRLRPGTIMPDASLKPAEAQAIARYLLGAAKPAKAAAPAGGDAATGEKLFVERGCRGCHAVKRGETSVSERVPNLSDVGVKLRPEWVAAWLRSPRAYSPHTAMPQVPLTDDEVRQLVAYLASLREGPPAAPGVPRFDAAADAAAGRAAIEAYGCASCHELKGFPAPRPAFELAGAQAKPDEVLRDGRTLVEFYNCRGCHSIEAAGGAIAKHLSRAGLAPPILDGEGARVQNSWLVDFLQKPQPLRPWLAMRMPDFGMDEARAEALARYFAAVSNVPAKDEPLPAVPQEQLDRGVRRVGHFKCTQCHLTGDAIPSGADPEDLSINLMLAKTRLRPSWIREFLAQPKKFAGPQTRMPAVFFAPDGSPRVEHAEEDIGAIAAYLTQMKEPPAATLARIEEERKKKEAPTDWTKMQY